MIEPEHPTAEYCQGRITFHESQALWFADHDQDKLAEWAHGLAERWQWKLKALKAKEEAAK